MASGAGRSIQDTIGTSVDTSLLTSMSASSSSSSSTPKVGRKEAKKQLNKLRTHVPLIKFKFGSEHRVSGIPKVATTVASSNTSKAPSSKRGQTIEFHMLPSKYQRLPLTQEEIDCINLGGPD